MRFTASSVYTVKKEKEKRKEKKRKDKMNLGFVVQYDTIENEKPFHSSPLSNIKLPRPNYQVLQLTGIEKIRSCFIGKR